MMVMPSGMRAPPPSPWSVRQTISAVIEGANPRPEVALHPRALLETVEIRDDGHAERDEGAAAEPLERPADDQRGHRGGEPPTGGSPAPARAARDRRDPR